MLFGKNVLFLARKIAESVKTLKHFMKLFFDNKQGFSRKSYYLRRMSVFALGGLFSGCLLYGQAVAKPEPDVLVFTDGEKLVGHVVSGTGSSLTFHSEMAGDVTVYWSKVKELTSSEKFVIAEKGVTFHKHDDLTKVPQGTVSIADQNLQIAPAGGGTPQTVPVANVQNVIPQDSFLRAFHRKRLTEGWQGAAGLGLALVAATQNSRSLTTNLSLVRTVPDETWIDPSHRTSLIFNSAYGELTQSGTPTVKTNIIHADAEQDEFFNKRLFGFANAAFDHSSSQGLDLQQTYGIGLGYTLLKDPVQELDIKGEIAYIDYSYSDQILPDGTRVPQPGKHLVGAVITQIYNRNFAKGILLHEQVSFTPAFNDTSAYSTLGTINLSIPVYKRLAFTIGVVDSYLNEPPTGFKKNSFQFVTNLAYTFK
jgi:hypothetical protein